MTEAMQLATQRTVSPVTILIIDDDDIDVRFVCRAIRKHGIDNEIVVAHDGLEALDTLRNDPQRKIGWPWIVLLDINMPRLNGHEFLEELRADEKLRDTVVFVLTTSEQDHDMHAAYEQNIAGYIVKSDAGTNFVNLVAMLDSFLLTVHFHAKQPM